MSGNVWEWCWDRYDENYYRNSPRFNPRGPETGDTSVLRGGSWFFDEKHSRTTNRFRSIRNSAAYHYGFRIVRSE